MRRRSLVLAVAWIAGAPGCTKSPPKGGGELGVAAPSPSAPLSREELAQPIFEGGFKNGWQDWGWAPRKASGPGPAELHFANWGGWILAKPGFAAETYGSLVFRVRPPSGEAEFLEVRVESPAMTTFPRIKIGAEHRTAGPDGWYEVRVPMF